MAYSLDDDLTKFASDMHTSVSTDGKTNSEENFKAIHFECKRGSATTFVKPGESETEGDKSFLQPKVEDLTEEEIKMILELKREELLGIFEGRVRCERHEKFQKGGNEKKSLNMMFMWTVDVLTNDQHHAVGKYISSLFPSIKCGNYTVNVLIPEGIALVYGYVNSLDRDEANNEIKRLFEKKYDSSTDDERSAVSSSRIDFNSSSSPFLTTSSAVISSSSMITSSSSMFISGSSGVNSISGVVNLNNSTVISTSSVNNSNSGVVISNSIAVNSSNCGISSSSNIVMSSSIVAMSSSNVRINKIISSTAQNILNHDQSSAISQITFKEIQINSNDIPAEIKEKMLAAIETGNIFMAEEVLREWKLAKKVNSAQNNGRQKVKCPACDWEVLNLTRHLKSKKHSWSDSKAQAARLNFGLRKQRGILPDESRKSKSRTYTKRLCPMKHCMKEVKRIGNHLRQFHKLSNEKARKYSEKAIAALHDQMSESSEECSSEDEEEEKRLLDWKFAKEIHRPGGDGFNWESIDGDTDWLGQKYFEIRESTDPRTGRCIVSDVEKESYNREDEEKSENETEAGGNETEETDERVESEEDENEVDFEDNEEKFFMSGKDEDELLDSFVQWLCSPDGGRKPKRTAMQHKSVLMTIVRLNDSEVKYTNLYNRTFLNQWMNQMHDDSKKPGTVKTYLGSVLHFFNYIYVSSYEKIFDLNEIRKMETVVKQWRRNLWKEIKVQGHQKALSDISRFPMPNEIKLLDNADATKDALATINFYKCQEHANVLKKSFCLVRDYLLTNIIFDNASRPGAVSNMTLHEFDSALNQTDGFVVRVLKHKNAHMGPANISISRPLYKHMKGYIKYIRNKLPGIGVSKGDPVFVSWGGGKMDGSMVTNQFNSFWSRVHGKTDRLNPTLIRKYTTTTIHQNNPSLKEDTADLLCHSLSTAVNSYNLVDKQSKASYTSKCIQEAQRTSFNSKFSNEKLAQLFEDEIHVGRINIDVVREKLGNLECKPKCEKEVKRILDFVRYQIKCRGNVHDDKGDSEEVAEPEVQQMSMENEIENGATGESMVEHRIAINNDQLPKRRKFFTVADNNLILEHLGHYVNSDCPIIRSQFEQYVRTIPVLKNLVEKFGIKSLIVKMRTERKNR